MQERVLIRAACARPDLHHEAIGRVHHGMGRILAGLLVRKLEYLALHHAPTRSQYRFKAVIV